MRGLVHMTSATLPGIWEGITIALTKEGIPTGIGGAVNAQQRALWKKR